MIELECQGASYIAMLRVGHAGIGPGYLNPVKINNSIDRLFIIRRHIVIARLFAQNAKIKMCYAMSVTAPSN